ncbi:hypothetical protein EDD56_109189 [Pseudobacteriovorax antillogorgiicola]|nr:hypothetical protein EDD56_109189 [Pseudobacteriovorax antillogorgiicola]
MAHLSILKSATPLLHSDFEFLNNAKNFSIAIFTFHHEGVQDVE